MTIEALTTWHYPYEEGRKQMPGTEDWVEVFEVDEGGYEWTTFRAYYSPSARRYFWHGDAGCSCNDWSDGVDNSGDFENGDKDALAAAWERFAKDHKYSLVTSDYIDGLADLKKFKP